MRVTLHSRQLNSIRSRLLLTQTSLIGTRVSVEFWQFIFNRLIPAVREFDVQLVHADLKQFESFVNAHLFRQRLRKCSITLREIDLVH
jgi:uncharacterized protein (UPF0371 family)